MTSYKRGDVILVRFPYSDLTHYKKRPALIVMGDEVQSEFNQTIAVMITSNLQRTGPTRIPINMQDAAAQAMGLLTDSVIVTDHLATIEEREIDKKIGHCPLMAKVDDALKITLGLY
ncbi:MAG TPA: type II toxin-antitoxin system PemK/MazF family toxin [Termitinemataceae bacterium]|jgi:mRNA interferase MazF|uniref:type II toxin-antitoxin system PemK/MazF family toxin n=1 Tax=Treponema sp. J25 TaxID=2094121 RepID=UPI001049371B|nr:type II toxin-antitoxin system PemK/MazF family toxin [Treponema sp. J25]TCW61247.1 transcriptional regulator [Treponema sp. J25]HOJ99793.1 type II toxin-antitoxin system PemK/MazF family toxin [Termitinemataceae bacterium]HOM24081.1 type II toxin-antitoxin system PemK/MazF family toxin [Termitinemataceae bacterium]HPQ00016.1 type II toxin-antitoxin system PemK/MazF family toxin [Termitinemataceae bacterium]